MAYSKKVIEKFENTLNEPEKFNVGRFDPKEANIGTKAFLGVSCAYFSLITTMHVIVLM